MKDDGFNFLFGCGCAVFIMIIALFIIGLILGWSSIAV